MCKAENHPLKTVKAKKRFFECRQCKRRTSSLDKLPRKACGNCNNHSWQRVAMAKVMKCLRLEFIIWTSFSALSHQTIHMIIVEFQGKTGPKLESEILSLRGDELNHYSASSSQVYLHV